MTRQEREAAGAEADAETRFQFMWEVTLTQQEGSRGGQGWGPPVGALVTLGPRQGSVLAESGTAGGSLCRGRAPQPVP